MLCFRVRLRLTFARHAFLAGRAVDELGLPLVDKKSLPAQSAVLHDTIVYHRVSV